MEPPSESSPLRHTAAGASDQGRSRSRNEDAYLVDDDLGLLVVADGMGGHPAGDVASALAVEEVQRTMREESSRLPVGERMVEAVRSADRRIRDLAIENPSQRGMGTTLTALLAGGNAGGQITIGHVGDSRAYLMEGGRIVQLTRDHTWVEEQVRSGTLTPQQARNHRWAHMLIQAVGVSEKVEPDLVTHVAAAGQLYLLCSDGLTNMLSDSAIEGILKDNLEKELDVVAGALVDAANARGGIDNITVGLLRLD